MTKPEISHTVVKNLAVSFVPPHGDTVPTKGHTATRAHMLCYVGSKTRGRDASCGSCWDLETEGLCLEVKQSTGMFGPAKLCIPCRNLAHSFPVPKLTQSCSTQQITAALAAQDAAASSSSGDTWAFSTARQQQHSDDHALVERLAAADARLQAGFPRHP